MTGPVGDLDAHLVASRGAFTLDVSLHVPAGTTAALLGPNGAGKSTTIDAISGLLAIDKGSIRLGDRTLDDPVSDTFVAPEHRRIGVVFQQYLLFEHLDVVDNIAFGPTSAGRRRSEARAVARAWIEALDLAALAERRPSQLSGGQAQRVALARALATEPGLLLLDEPLAALDVEVRSQLRRVLADHLGEFAGPRLIITHDPTDAILLADRIHVLEAGRITQTGTPEDIRRRPATRYVAALAGTNLLRGTSAAGRLTLDDHPLALQAADAQTNGPVLITIHPTAIALHADEPHGSPRNAWSSVVDALEPLGDTVRVTLGAPLPLAVDITPSAADSLGLVPGQPVWAAVKATEIDLNPA